MDKNMPDGVEECIVNPDGVQRYRDLREVERWLDATTTRKRLDASENFSRGHTKLLKTLRIWISNTVEDQVWQSNGLNVDAFDFTPNMEASYRVRIEGRLLDEREHEFSKPETSGVLGVSSTPQQDESSTAVSVECGLKDHKHRFSYFFRALSVDFDRSRFRNGAEQNIEWKKPETTVKGHAPGSLPAIVDFDELTFKRNGDENTNITINLYRHEMPERYQLSPELAEVVDMKDATQQEAVMGLWEYIRFWGLQEDEEKRNFRCDELLKQVVGRGDSGRGVS
ncbi:hypothetical protein CDD83_3617 [Cordyceps sp. RAO-2017]|nr:hypothetical protein CDD83_3617 [Cordyceps sp. RAO-2017]